MKARKLNKGELSFIIFMGIISMIVFILSLKMFMKDMNLSSQGAFPLFVSGIMLLMSFLMLFEIRKCGGAFEKGLTIKVKLQETVQFLLPGKLSFLMVYVFLYGIGLRYIGFNICTMLFLWGSMVMFNRDKSIKSLVKSFIISLGVLIFILIIFQYIFKVVLP